MSKTINIITHGRTFTETLNDSATAEAIWNALPLESKANTWGDEIYFDIGISADMELGASATVQLYDLGYWPPGHAFCIFFGRTPMSTGNEIRAASPVNLIGRIEALAEDLRKVPDGSRIRLEKVQ
jgi:hypothetical protein